MIVAKVSVQDDSWLQRFGKRIKDFKGWYVTIGVHEDAGQYESGVTVAEVALWNEFGTRGRGAGHNNTFGPAFAIGAIPERSFLRSTIDENEALINQWRMECIEKIISARWTPRQALEAIGFRIQVLIQNKIKSNVPPPNAPSTLARKAASGAPQQTLMDTKLLLRSIQYRVVEG